MSLTIIGISGVLAGILCVLAGFFMDEAKDHTLTQITRQTPERRAHARGAQHRRKAA